MQSGRKSKNFKTGNEEETVSTRTGREKLIKDVTLDDPYNFSDIQELKSLYAAAITRCHTKQPGQSAPSTAVVATTTTVIDRCRRNTW